MTVSAVSPGTGYESWPVIARASDGSLVVAYGDGANHQTDTTRKVVVQRSTDEGATWGPQITVRDTTLDNAVFSIGSDSAGDLLMFIRDRGPTADEYAHVVVKSTDNGATWTVLSSPTFTPEPQVVGPIISVPTVGLMCFWQDFEGAGTTKSWGTFTSADDGATWTQNTHESGLPTADHPVEIRAVYLGDGKLLAIGRTEDTTPGAPLFQLTSNDYGATWTKADSNITDQFRTPTALLLDGPSVHAFYYERGEGLLHWRQALIADVMADPTAWPESTVIATGATAVADAGYTHAIDGGSGALIVFYSGDASNTAIYLRDLST